MRDEYVGLAGDLGYEPDTSAIENKVEKLEELNSKIKDLKWSKDEMKYALDSDINQAKSLTQKIKQMRKIISVSKKLGGIFGLKTKGSEKVAALQQGDNLKFAVWMLPVFGLILVQDDIFTVVGAAVAGILSAVIVNMVIRTTITIRERKKTPPLSPRV